MIIMVIKEKRMCRYSKQYCNDYSSNDDNDDNDDIIPQGTG